MSVHKKINKVMQNISKVIKSKTVGEGRNAYKALQHDDLTRELRPHCIEAGLVLIPTMESCETTHYPVTNSYGKESLRYESQVWVTINAVDIESSEGIVIKSFAHGFDNQDKSVGKAFSMAVKYGYLKLFMIESGDDEEERLPSDVVEHRGESNNPKKTNKSKLQNELRELLKLAGKYNKDTEVIIQKINEDQLKSKINEYRAGNEKV